MLQAAKELKAAKRQKEDPSEQEANATQKISRLKRELADFARTLDLMLGRRSRVVLQEAEKRLGEEAGRRLAQLMEETASGPAFYQAAAEDTAQRVFLAKVQAMREQDKIEDEPVVRKINELVGKRAENGAPGGFAAQIDQFSEVRIRSEEGRQAFVEVDIDMLTVLVLLWKPPKAVAEAGRAVEQEREDDMARKRVGFIMGLIIRKIFKYISARGWDEELRLFAANETAPANWARRNPRRWSNWPGSWSGCASSGRRWFPRIWWKTSARAPWTGCSSSTRSRERTAATCNFSRLTCATPRASAIGPARAARKRSTSRA
jgi:hypothetical protein